MFELSSDIRNKGAIVHIDTQHLPCFVNANHSICVGVTSCYEDQGVCYALPVESCTIGDLKHIQISKLSNEKDHSIPIHSLHEHWEVSLHIRRHVQLWHLLELLLAWSRVAYLHKVNTLLGFCGLFLSKYKQVVLESRIVSNSHITEVPSESFQHLLLSLLYHVQLHVSVYHLLLIWVETHQETPLLLGINPVIHYLASL